MLLGVAGAALAADREANRPGDLRVVYAGSAIDGLQAVARNARQVIAVGARGRVFVSRDGAETWERTAIAGRPPLIDVAACPDGSFFLLDFRRGLWRRGDTDDRWERRAIAVAGLDPTPRSLALRCDPAGRLWAVGEESSILSSDDRGVRWQSTLPDRTDRLLTAIGFVDTDRVRVLGEFGTTFLSDDAGATWQRGPDIPEELYPHAAHVAGDGTLWVVGATGHIYRLAPGPERWEAEASGTTRALYGRARVGPSLVAVGAGGEALLRDDGWRALALPRRAGVAWAWRGIASLGPGVFVAVGEGGAMRVAWPSGAADSVASAEGP